jgi:hypothetical protein
MMWGKFGMQKKHVFDKSSKIMPAEGLQHTMTTPTYPSAGSVLPVAQRVAFGGSSNGQQVLRCVVTTTIAAGTVLGFRFFVPTNGYMSPFATTITFATAGVLLPGDFIEVVRSAPGSGTVLNRIRYPTPCADGEQATIGSTVTDLLDTIAGNSCYMYWSPNKCAAPDVALAVVTGTGPGASDPVFLPPPCALPCQYVVSPSVSPDPPVDFVVLGSGGAKGGAIPGLWKDAWQLCRYRAWVGYQEPATAWDVVVDALSAGLYIAPPPGALIPLGVKPHLAGSSFMAQLVLVATTVIPAGTTLQLTASVAVDPLPYWAWTAPADADVPAGTVLNFAGLGLVPAAFPWVNIGTVVRVPTTDPDTADLTDFTVFSINPCDAANVEGRTYVTALYTCARPTGSVLPPGLTVGVDMPCAPWPAPCASIVAVTGVRPESWPMAAWALNHAKPVAWSWQPVPVFRTAPLCGGLHNALGRCC